MRHLVPLVAAAALSACGVDTASSAATAAALKKQEVEQAKKTVDQTQKKIGQAMEQLQQSQQTRDEASRQ